jgi:micrococcal nuclease
MFQVGQARRLIAALLLSVLLEAAPPAFAATFRGFVRTVFDGDTIEVVLDGGAVEKVRYLLIDTPEMHHPRRGSEEFGIEAGLANRELVLGRRVRLETDVQPRDRYGRLLAFVWLDRPGGPVMVNEKLVEEGFALPFTVPPNVRHADRIHAALLKARNERRGFWNAASGRVFTPRQVWADLPLLAGAFVTLDMKVERVSRSGKRWILSEKKSRTRITVYDDRPGLFGSITALEGKRLRVVGKVQASYNGAELLLVDPVQVLSITPLPPEGP